MIGQIEQAIIDRLAKVSESGALGYRWRQVESMPIDADDRVADSIVEYPSCWVAYSGWKPLRAVGRWSVEVEATWHVIVGAENLRNERSTRMGASDREVGSYQMVWDVCRLLGGEDFGLQIGGLAVKECFPLYAGALKDKRKISLFATAFTTRFTIDPSDDRTTEGMGDFKVFHANWDLPQTRLVDADPETAGVQLPADDQAPFTDHVILQPGES